MDRSNKRFLLLAIGVPTLFLIALFVVIYLPQLGFRPQYDFVYGVAGQYYYPGGWRQYAVSDGRLVENPPPENREMVYGERGMQLFYHDVKTNQSRAITFDQAKELRLSGALYSPDQETLSHGAYDDYSIFPFYGGSRDYNSIYLKNNSVSRKMEVNAVDYYYFVFLGWVL